MNFVIFLLIGSLITLFLFGFGIAILFRWVVHTYRRTHPKCRKRKKNVWLEYQWASGHMCLDESLRFDYLGSLERFVVKKHSDKDPLGEEVGYVYASFRAAYEMKYVDSPGVLTYYYYGDKMFFAKFEPYSKEEAERYFPEIKRNEAEFTYLIGMLFIVGSAIAMFLIALPSILP